MSYFKRPFRSPGEQPPQPGLAPQMSAEWAALEERIRVAAPSADLGQLHAEVGEFLRRWGVALTTASPPEQGALDNLLESARASLLGQLGVAAESARAWQQQASQQASRQAQQAQQRALADAEHARRMEAGRAEVRRLQEETARIQAETYQSSRLAADRNHQLARAALFPENHCPYCSRSYLDLSGGCWNCQHHHRPGYF